MMKKIFSCDSCAKDFDSDVKDSNRYINFTYQENNYNGLISFSNQLTTEKQHYCDDCFIQLASSALTSLKK